MKKIVVILVLIFVIISLCDSARILGIIPTPSYSHQAVFQPFWKELSLRGHQVTVLTSHPINDATLTNLTEIDTSFSFKLLTDNLVDVLNNSGNALKVIDLSVKLFCNVFDKQLELPQVKRFINDPSVQFDLVIFEYTLSVPMAFSKKFNCPSIAILPTDSPNILHKLFGHPTHPVLYPDSILDSSNLTLVKRVIAVLFNVIFELYIKWSFMPYQESMMQKHFGSNYNLNEIEKRASLVFINSDPIFYPIRPITPMMIPIGGQLMRLPPKPLEKVNITVVCYIIVYNHKFQYIKQKLDNAQEGFIYFSLGSNIDGKDMPEKTLKVILETFKELPYTVLWKYELDLPNKPDNVVTSKWLSQLEVLKHPNIKLFITHGGGQSVDEAVSARVQILGMPFCTDQPFTVDRMVTRGAALSVDHKTLEKENFKAIILELINNPTNYNLNEIKKSASLVFINSDPIFYSIRPITPMMIPIGGQLMRLPPKPLEENIKQKLDNAQEAFIYFSLGSNIDGKDMPKKTLKVILETFKELPYTVLWKYEVPILGIPFCTDQPFTVNRMVTRGAALSVDYKTLEKENFKAIILELINNPTYRKRITKLADLAEDQPMTGLERAVWWTEYVLRHNGTKHLKNPIFDMPCARILGIIPTPSYSHQALFQPFWKELSLRGHQVTVLTSHPINDATLTNLTEIDTSFSFKLLNDNTLNVLNNTENVLDVIDFTAKAFCNVFDKQLELPQVKRFINDPSVQFDLVIFEYILSAPMAFSKKFNCPSIGVLPMDSLNIHHKILGHPTHSVLYPDPLLDNSHLTLKKRVIAVIFDFFFELYFQWRFIPFQESVLQKHFDDNYNLKEMSKNISLIMVNSDPIFFTIRPITPMMIPIGGQLMRLPPKPLEKVHITVVCYIIVYNHKFQNIKQKLDNAQEGFIYFSLGSNINGKDMPEKTSKVILETFKELPYTVLWKYELDLPNKPDNVVTSKWLSQLEVLKHPNIKLFITHGGGQSVDEAVSARVPILGMPFFPDQPFTVNRMVTRGAALSVDYKTLEKENFKAIILELINNPMLV
ncbi:hypothetical protein RN001_014362 [Aquatica leii]|uniref:UDP-glycosyltransferase n=1 Tax=Aquatica leii TaxID=1421715 RepID=A0AAN7P0G2_9COLE|nr:hypothetical protein RN001_014362 [Aquatica leii]